MHSRGEADHLLALDRDGQVVPGITEKPGRPPRIDRPIEDVFRDSVEYRSVIGVEYPHGDRHRGIHLWRTISSVAAALSDFEPGSDRRGPRSTAAIWLASPRLQMPLSHLR